MTSFDKQPLATPAPDKAPSGKPPPDKTPSNNPQNLGQPPKVPSLQVTSTDGVKLSVQVRGAEAGAEILFIHGFNQAHLSWQHQVDDETLAAEFKMVTFDLRGHGASDKPLDPVAYHDDRRWADDVAAVIAAAGLKRPVLVGWSYAGRVVSDYLRWHGQDRVAAINFVAAVVMTGPGLMGPGRRHFAEMTNGDLAANVAGTRAFLRACFSRQLPQDGFETLLAYNMAMSPQVRAMVLDRTPNSGDLLPQLKMPVLFTHGADDQIVRLAMSEQAAARVPDARLSVYDHAGHIPFVEDTARFNAELAAFVRAAQRS
jgi:pimeloyl-ACP methyl ester carboxylesterase